MSIGFFLLKLISGNITARRGVRIASETIATTPKPVNLMILKSINACALKLASSTPKKIAVPLSAIIIEITLIRRTWNK